MVNAILYHLMKQHSMLIISNNYQSKTWTIYLNEYTQHHATDKEYTLSQLAKKAFTAYTKRDQYENEAKSAKNVSKIATVLHVPWHLIDNLLQLKTEPTLAMISGDVMNMAISLSDYFWNFKGITQAIRNIIYVYFCLFRR